MGGHGGSFRLYIPESEKKGNVRRDEMERWGIPLLSDLSEAGPNDCLASMDGFGTNGKGTALKALQSLGKATPWYMNVSSRAVMSLSAEEIERRLRREGLPARIGDEGREGTRIQVTVWGLEAVGMKRVRSAGTSKTMKINEVKYRRFSTFASEQDIIPQEHPIWKPAERLSVRAIYALGLDFGQATIRLSDSGTICVTGISSVWPRISDEVQATRLRDLLQLHADRWEKESGSEVHATLGADPEFVLLSPSGRIVSASKFFAPEDDAGCDSVRLRGEKIWPLVELRPRPTPDPMSLTADVRRLLRVAAERTAGTLFSWHAGAMPVRGLPLGGHIHLSGVELTGERLRALDNAVGLPLRLLEPPAAGKRRPRYGTLGDVRRQPHGGFEYRTPPSWLVSPRLTLGAFALAKAAAEHSRELAASRPLDDDGVRDAFYEGDRTVLLPAVEAVYRAIQDTEIYAAHRAAIDFVFDAIARGRSWNENADIRLKWHIPIR
ncbi:hypothetical protein D7Z26_02885 [Cohnella endophytica]|uniref:Phage phiEco32-like COOH-NH2 ligase-type 2 n=1 Tax=Cohnella endophytica TaxID=2419778 RepID=A0A494Y3T9_9BACL|nr:hypothetical protein [Cohnella endophytica]RKP56951.1 hypothetical protein D7Z26_02885 [Cohnella endophytica]